eukprot:gnl/MRDRNA2_/MRDRNA2_201031_c0_seq1.p1 gnl/MRDRNA2_/MRDRNA2_201031_c0~~gnl/MRDRNA2_/MRDRNA2_201031_c0_seq1.p1  ORF type:complete len:455 (+),score=51.28 gnl/MRDRNA2_/MRDRNA2_201031_c0_seq1:168-1367(+)
MSFPMISRPLLDGLGRRHSIIFGSLIFLVGCAVQGTAHSTFQILIGRFAAGLSIGLLSNAVTMYQGEVAPASIRGSLGSLYQLMITFGILVAAILDMYYVDHDDGWRWAVAMQSAPAVLLLVGMHFLPESPRWLVAQGRNEEALQILSTMRTETEAESEFRGILADHRLQGSEVPSYNLLLQGRVSQLLKIGVSLQLLQQLVGMNAFMYFGPRIFKDLNMNQNESQTLMNTVNFVATFPALYLADRYGRRCLLVWSATGMTIACLGIGILSHFDPASKGISAFIFFFIVNFAYGWGPIIWVYCGEIFPLKYRAWCLGLTTMSNWIGNWIIAQCTPVLLEVLGFITFFIFGGFCLVALAMALWLPETKGLVLEHVSQAFDEKLGCDRKLDKAAKYGSLEA